MVIFAVKRCIVTRSNLPTSIFLSKAGSYVSESMVKLIREEQELTKEKMKGRKGGNKTTAAMPEFTQIRPGVFVFCGNFYFIMSKVNITSWQRCVVTVASQTRPMKPCKLTSHRWHDGLLPFFFDSMALLAHYSEILQDDEEPVERKEEVAVY